MTLSETLVPFAKITFFPDTIFDFYRGGYDGLIGTCTLRKNHLFSGRTPPDEHLDSKAADRRELISLRGTGSDRGV